MMNSGMRKPSLAVDLGVFTTIRLVINTAIRLAVPFLAVLARGMGVDVAAVSLALAGSMVASAAGPFLAPIADRRGRRAGMLVGLGIFITGSLAAAIFPSYYTFFLAVFLGNLGNNVFLPAMHAYLSDATPYSRRGLVLAVTETSWALCYILIIPLVGILIDQTAWYTPFGVVAALGMAMVAVILLRVPKDVSSSDETAIFSGFRLVFSRSSALFALLMGFLFIVGNEAVSVMFGVWMEDSFHLQIAALGAASAAVGLAELGGEGLSALLADRLGKERSIILGLATNSAVLLALPLIGGSLAGGVIWLFLFFITFELAIVASLPLVTEILPEARATLMGVYIAVLSLGRGAGDALAPFLYGYGYIANAAVCVVLNLLALAALRGIRLQTGKAGIPELEKE